MKSSLSFVFLLFLLFESWVSPQCSFSALSVDEKLYFIPQEIKLKQISSTLSDVIAFSKYKFFCRNSEDKTAIYIEALCANVVSDAQRPNVYTQKWLYNKTGECPYVTDGQTKIIALNSGCDYIDIYGDLIPQNAPFKCTEYIRAYSVKSLHNFKKHMCADITNGTTLLCGDPDDFTIRTSYNDMRRALLEKGITFTKNPSEQNYVLECLLSTIQALKYNGQLYKSIPLAKTSIYATETQNKISCVDVCDSSLIPTSIEIEATTKNRDVRTFSDAGNVLGATFHEITTQLKATFKENKFKVTCSQNGIWAYNIGGQTTSITDCTTPSFAAKYKILTKPENINHFYKHGDYIEIKRIDDGTTIGVTCDSRLGWLFPHVPPKVTRCHRKDIDEALDVTGMNEDYYPPALIGIDLACRKKIGDIAIRFKAVCSQNGLNAEWIYQGQDDARKEVRPSVDCPLDQIRPAVTK